MYSKWSGFMKQFLKQGDKFGRLTVIRYSHKELVSFAESRKNYNKYFYECRCDCGKYGLYDEKSLRNGNTKSCGCLNHDSLVERNKTHNLSKTRLYKIYHGIKKRCYNSNSKSYKNYGARGIGMDKEWLDDFMNFYLWAINNGYADGLTIERIDVNKNYCPENCTWIPVSEQAKNTTRNVFYEYKGEKHILSDWAKIYNLPFTCVRRRLDRGWSIEIALTTPKLRG